MEIKKEGLRWGIVGCGMISHDFVKCLEQSRYPHKVSYSSCCICVYLALVRTSDRTVPGSSPAAEASSLHGYSPPR